MHHPLRVRGPRASLSELSLRCLLALAAPTLSLTVLSSAARAEEAATGIVVGRVMNASNGMYLNKARVTVEGTTIETLTNDFGEFRLANVPAGEAKIVATFTGQEPATATVTVEAGKSVSKDLSFGQATVGDDGVIRLDPYIVATERFRNAQEIATQEERFSVNIKNVVAADAFGANPSGNVGEFVKFMPGILVDYGAGGGAGQGTADADATGINIRGIGAADTAVMIDGMPVSNAFPGSLSRQVFLDTLSINNASRVEVTKVPTPDMPANSVGGAVNLISRSAFEYAKPTFNYSIYLTGNKNYLSTKETPGPTNQETRKINPAATFSVAYPLSKSLGFSVSGSYVPEFKQNQRASMTWTPGTLPANSVLAPMTVDQVRATLAPIYAQARLDRYQIADTPQAQEKISGNLKVDWKPFPGHSLSVNLQGSKYESIEGQRNLDYRTGTASAFGPDFTAGQVSPTNGGRIAMVVRARDRIGDTKSGSLRYQMQYGGWQVNLAANRSVSKSEYVDRQNGHFSEVAAIIGNSTSAPLKVSFYDIKDGLVGRVETLSLLTGTPAVDTTKLSTWRFDGDVRARSGEAFSDDTVSVYQLDVRRELDFLPFATSVPLALKVGIRRDEKDVKKYGIGSNYYEALNTGKAVAFSDIIDRSFVGQSPGFGLPAQEWLDNYRFFALDQQQDLFSVTTETNKIDNYNSYVNQQKAIVDRKDAWYAMLEGRALKGRFSFVGGLRQEKSSRNGLGPYTDNRYNFVKTLTGNVYREENTVVTVSGVAYRPYINGVNFGTNGNISATRVSDGAAVNIANPLFTTNDGGLVSRMKAAGLWFPTNPDGTPRVLNNTTLEGRMLQLQANKPIHAEQQGDPSYSLAGSFDITKDLVAKLSWSRTFKQPALEDGNFGLLSGNGAFSFNESTTATAGLDGLLYIGEIRMANPDLKPETSNNWDTSLSYYFKNGAKLTASYYWKEIEDAIVNVPIFPSNDEFDDILATAGYDPTAYQNYFLSTSTNSDGMQKTTGFELDGQTPLGFLGAWGKYFDLFASFSKKNLGDPVPAKPVIVNGKEIAATNQRTLTLSANTFAAGGMKFTLKRFSSTIRATYRARNETGTRTTITYTPTGGTSTPVNYIRNFQPSEIRWDASVDYQIGKNFSVYATGKDILNAQRKQYREDDEGWLPAYSSWTDYRRFGVEVTVGVRGSF